MPRFVDKIQNLWNPAQDEYEDYYDDEEEAYDDRREEPVRRSSYSSSRESRDSSSVSFNPKPQLQVVLFKPTSFGEETRSIADELLQKHTVVLNMEKVEKDVVRRIVDFLSGVAYANNGKIKRIATNIFIITPYNVDLTGDDLLDELGSSGLYF